MNNEKTSRQSGRGILGFLMNNVIMISLFVLIVVIAIMQPRFMSTRVLRDILIQNSSRMIIACGMSMVLISGGMDLSIGACCSMCTVLCATFIGTMGMNTTLALIITLAIAVVCGAFNGFLDLGANFVGHLTDDGALFGGQLTHAAQDGSQFAFFAQILDSEGFRLVQRLGFRQALFCFFK